MSTMTSEVWPTRSDVLLRSAAPHTDESLSSSLDRAASLWGVARWELLRYLGHNYRAYHELDGPLPESLLQSIAQAFGVEPAILDEHAVPRHRLDSLLAPQHRHAYCPLCFDSDWLSGVTPYFRLDWGRLWATHCHVHGTPLFEWIAVNGYGDRRIPHLFFLPYDTTASLPTWIAVNLKDAQSWRSSALRHSHTHDLWQALVNVEKAWWAAGIGGLCETVTSKVVDGESVLIRLAALFLVARHAGQPCLAETLRIPPHQHRVLGYDRRRQGRHTPNGNFRMLRGQLPSIQARRTVLILTAHTLEQLKVDVWFETGALMPSGHSQAWASRILSHQLDRGRAENSLRAMGRW